MLQPDFLKAVIKAVLKTQAAADKWVGRIGKRLLKHVEVLWSTDWQLISFIFMVRLNYDKSTQFKSTLGNFQEPYFGYGIYLCFCETSKKLKMKNISFPKQ